MSTTPPPIVIKSTSKTPDNKWEVTTTTSTQITPINQPPNGGGSGGGIEIPSNAKTSGVLDNSDKWKGMKDAGTPGTVSSAFSKFISTTEGRQFNAVQKDHAGYRWSNQFGSSQAPTNFVYALFVKSPNWGTINCLELDMNHVLENSPGNSKGPNVFLCIQASQYSKTWEYTLVSNNKTHWVKSNIGVDLHAWAPNVWKEIKLKTSHDAKGIVTYEQVELDGVAHSFSPDCKGPAIENINWDAGHMLVNYQMGGSTSAESTMNTFARDFQVWYW